MSGPDAARVIVLGASGLLGTRIVALLRRELPGVRVIGACRHPDALDTPEARRLDLDDPSGFAPALEGVDALIHAAGPFDRDPAPLVRACLEAGVDYLDLAEDPVCVSRVQAAADALAAPRARAVPGCSTVPGLVALLAHRFEGREDVATVDAYLSLGSRNPASVGLLYGLLRPIGRPGAGGRPWFSRLVRFRFHDGRARSFGRHPLALEKGLLLGGRGVPVRLFVGFDRAFLSRGLARLGPLLSRLSDAALRRLCARALPLASVARLMGSEEGRLALVARDPGEDEIGRVELHAYAEGLDVPATPPVWALRRLLEARDDPPPGPVALEELIAPGAALAWLRARGYGVVESRVA